MTLSEYMSVAISIVMSLALVRVVSGISHAVAAGRLYWVRLVWIPVMRLCYGEYPVAAGRHVSSSQSFGQPFDSGVSYA